MFKVLLGLTMVVFLAANDSLALAEESSSICFAHKGEFLCVQAENSDKLIEKVEQMELPSGEYFVFIQKSVGWKMKKHFSKNSRIDSAKLISFNAELPEVALKRVEKQSQQEHYYLAKIVIK